MDTVKEKIRKINALVNDPGASEGEKASAMHHLDLLLGKYRVTLDDVLALEPERTRQFFSVANRYEAKLLLQIIGMVTNKKDILLYRKNRKHGFDLAPGEYVDASELYGTYRKALKKETDRLFVAFLHRHELFPYIDGGTPQEEVQMSKSQKTEIRKMFSMARTLLKVDRPSCRPRIGDGGQEDLLAG